MRSEPSSLLCCRVLTLAMLSGLVGCKSKGVPSTVLQPEDLSAPVEGFDPNEILNNAALTDGQALGATQVQDFLDHSPYKRPSFLSTYQSHGLSAAGAIVRAADKYDINPIVFLVRAQMDQGLIGERTYPFPPARVEYVFGCGCSAAGSCEPNYAGFDRQVDCLGATLRGYLDDISARGATAGGWAPDVERTTLDGEKVTPADAATAALYQYAPQVGRKSGSGNYLLFRVWTAYTMKLDYAAPVTGGPLRAWIGDRCDNDGDCGRLGEDAQCATNYPGGLCTVPCTGTCPTEMGKPQAYCASFKNAGYCLLACDPNVEASCRPGYACINVAQVGTGQGRYVCIVK